MVLGELLIRVRVQTCLSATVHGSKTPLERCEFYVLLAEHDRALSPRSESAYASLRLQQNTE